MLGTMLTGKLRYYQPFMLLSAICLTVGSGLFAKLQSDTPPVKWVIYEIIVGAGTGVGTALPLLAVQDILQPSDVPVEYAVVLAAGYLGSSIALALSQAIFASRLKQNILTGLPGIGPLVISNAGATDLRNLLPSELYEQGLRLYNDALTESWYISIVLAGISVFLTLGYKWKKMDMRDKR